MKPVEALENICKSIKDNNLDGIICSNTTIQHNDKNGKGGLSGLPLFENQQNVSKELKKL